MIMKIFKDERIDRYLTTLKKDQLAKIIQVTELFRDYGYSLSNKHLKKLNRQIWELKIEKHRILFGEIKNGIVIVNIFYKKTQKTPKKELRLAIQRLKYHI